MKILRKTEDLHIDLNIETDFQTNAGWQENLQQFEDEVLYDIINPIDNYETIRYIHKPYSGITEFSGDTQCDIWFYFYFLNPNTNDYTSGLDYSHVGITPQENAKLLKATSESFFRLEFYKTPLTSNGLSYQAPTRYNRRLVFAKNLSLPLGEKLFYQTIRKNIHVPVFMGSNYRNKENMYLFWFQDDTVLEETNLSGVTSNTNTFFMTAKFFNKTDGSIIDFTNTPFDSTYQINDVSDMYYQVDIDKTDYSYKIHRFNGTVSQYGDRIGIITGNTINGDMGVSPIRFYERRSGVNINTTLTPTPTMTPTISFTPTNTPTPTPTPASGGGGGGTGGGPTYIYYKLRPCDYQGQSGYFSGTYDVWSTGYLSSVFEYGDRVEGSSNYFYVVVDSTTTTPNGTLFQVTPTGFIDCPDAPPLVVYRTVGVSVFVPDTYKTKSQVLTDVCNKAPYQIIGGNGYSTGNGGWVNELSISVGTTYQLYQNNIMGDGVTVPGPGKYCAILISGQGYIIHYVAYIDNTGFMTEITEC